MFQLAHRERIAQGASALARHFQAGPGEGFLDLPINRSLVERLAGGHPVVGHRRDVGDAGVGEGPLPAVGAAVDEVVLPRPGQQLADTPVGGGVRRGGDAGARVRQYELDAQPGQPGLQLSVRLEGDTAVVTGVRRVRPPFPVFGRDEVVVTAVARARAPVVVP